MEQPASRLTYVTPTVAHRVLKHSEQHIQPVIYEMGELELLGDHPLAVGPAYVLAENYVILQQPGGATDIHSVVEPLQRPPLHVPPHMQLANEEHILRVKNLHNASHSLHGPVRRPTLRPPLLPLHVVLRLADDVADVDADAIRGGQAAQGGPDGLRDALGGGGVFADGLEMVVIILRISLRAEPLIGDAAAGGLLGLNLQSGSRLNHLRGGLDHVLLQDGRAEGGDQLLGGLLHNLNDSTPNWCGDHRSSNHRCRADHRCSLGGCLALVNPKDVRRTGRRHPRTITPRTLAKSLLPRSTAAGTPVVAHHLHACLPRDQGGGFLDLRSPSA
mmetsp:Transcript_98531/g.226414  ORF Transcript_98531/g.226414 Transcript_98531/m.226414 type:complete len:331 (+) Transcript_98531:530-1522(+)